MEAGWTFSPWAYCSVIKLVGNWTKLNAIQVSGSGSFSGLSRCLLPNPIRVFSCLLLSLNFWALCVYCFLKMRRAWFKTSSGVSTSHVALCNPWIYIYIHCKYTVCNSGPECIVPSCGVLDLLLTMWGRQRDFQDLTFSPNWPSRF